MIDQILNLLTNNNVSRQVDAMIAFEFNAIIFDDATYSSKDIELYALRRTAPSTVLKEDIIEFEHPSEGWMIMNSKTVPYYTTSCDAALSLLKYNNDISIKIGKKNVVVKSGKYKCKSISLSLSIGVCIIALMMNKGD